MVDNKIWYCPICHEFRKCMSTATKVCCSKCKTSLYDTGLSESDWNNMDAGKQQAFKAEIQDKAIIESQLRTIADMKDKIGGIYGVVIGVVIAVVITLLINLLSMLGMIRL